MNSKREALRPTVGKPRDFRLDKAKGLLILLVVYGHLLEQISGWDMGFSRAELTAIYSFHMPAFVFLAGITSKSNRLLSRVLVFVVLLVSSQAVYYVLMRTLDGEDPDFSAIMPYWILWFLLAMIWWTLLVPVIERFPRAMVIVSLAAGAVGGIIPVIDYEFTVARTLTFLPFFVLGKLYGQRLIDWATSMNIPAKVGLTLAALVPMVLFFTQDLDKEWYYGARGFNFMDVAIPYGVGIRVLLGASAMLAIVALVSWTNVLPSLLTAAGQRSLSVYLLHGLIVRSLDKPLNAALDSASGSVMIVVTLVMAVLITALCSLSFFDRAIRQYSSWIAGVLEAALKSVIPVRQAGRH
ncbi:acyltransferase family protein [Brevibacterium sp. GP-SGM9]|uniref:acyltransferase family protein n=1 Tax=Brevibacterium sp. GP-SGM9 TaxID=3376990 RepID=UPI0039A6F19B